MPPWIPKAIALLMLAVAGLYAFFWLAVRLRHLLILILIAFFLSLAMEPAVNALARRGWRRGAATGLVFLLLLIFIVVFTTAIGSLFVIQLSGLIQHFPDYVQSSAAFFNDTFKTNFSSSQLAEQIRNSSLVQDFGRGVAVSALNAGTGLIGIVFQAFTVALFAFYLTANGPRVRRAVCSLLRPERQRTVLAVWDLAIDKTGGYVYSRALLAAVSALVTYLLLTVLGVPYALALALWVGLVSQFVPAVGTYLAGVVPVFVALLNDPIDAVWVLGFILLYQQVENYFLAPRITAQTMQLNAAVAFGSVLAGAAILGPIGGPARTSGRGEPAGLHLHLCPPLRGAGEPPDRAEPTQRRWEGKEHAGAAHPTRGGHAGPEHDELTVPGAARARSAEADCCHLSHMRRQSWAQCGHDDPACCSNRHARRPASRSA